MLEFDKGSTRSHFVERSLWNLPGACRETDYGMINEMR